MDVKYIHAFANKWYKRFLDPKTDYAELIDNLFADDCAALEFKMDYGQSFFEKYGGALHSTEELQRVIGEITDISLLGSAIYSQWYFYNHWEHFSQEIIKSQNRAWFTIALSRLAVLAECRMKQFKGIPQKIRIISDNTCYGPAPEPGDEVAQHITINAAGRVWFSAYNFGLGFQGYEKSRRKIFKIEAEFANRVLNSIAQFFSGDYIEVFATDIGSWNLEITNTDGVAYKYHGLLIADFEVDGVDLSDMVREALGMEELFVFDGNHKPDRVDRVTIDYHRKSLIESKQDIPESAEHTTGDYYEKLVLDRHSETLEHIQVFGSNCVVSRKYCVQGVIESLLDGIDVDILFGEIEGNPEDVVDDPHETRDYTITIDFKKGPQKTIQGTYDKKSLPEFWGAFADCMGAFLRSYDMGEILNPAIYKKAKRRRNEYIYCSVKFESGDKSYYYIADDDNICSGDYVIVPAGWDNHHSVAEVVKVEYFPEEKVPYPLNYTKHIVRKCTDEDFE